MRNQLVQKLSEVQQIMGENDSQFAERLGTSCSAWSLIRRRKRNMGLKVLGGHVTANFPALERYILAYLHQQVQTHKPCTPYTALTNPENRPTNPRSIMTRLWQETSQI
jgi:hypothetical protein